MRRALTPSARTAAWVGSARGRSREARASSSGAAASPVLARQGPTQGGAGDQSGVAVSGRAADQARGGRSRPWAAQSQRRGAASRAS